MKVIEHKYSPNATQVAFHSSNRKYKGFKGSKGSGKTRGLIEECILLCYECPGNRGIIARLDLGDLKETTMQFFFEFCPEELILERNRSEHFVVLRSKDPKRPSRIKFAHCKDPKSFESGEIGFFGLDESDEIPYETFQTLRTRIRLKGVPHYGLMAFNPTDRFHWLYRFFVKDIKDKPELFKSRQLFSNNTYENMRNLPASYIDELKDTYEGDELNRFLHGEWGSLSNEWAVCTEFKESIHVAKEAIEPVRGLPILRCWDFGMSAAVTFNQFVDGQFRTLYPELIYFGKGAEQMAPKVLQATYENYSDYAIKDISEPFANSRAAADAAYTCSTVLGKHGIHLKIRNDNWEQRKHGLGYFMERLVDGEAAYQIDSRNEVTITGLAGGWQYEENAPQRTAYYVKDNEYTHPCDTLQMAGCEYLAHTKGMKDIDLPSRPRYDFKHKVPKHSVIGGHTVVKRYGR